MDASKIRHEGDCWIWTGSTNGCGYGETSEAGKKVYTHRLMYERHVGPIPEGKDIDHLCRNRACCNPAHLEPVTRQENLLRGDTIPATLGKVPAQHVEHLVDRTDANRVRVLVFLADLIQHERVRAGAQPLAGDGFVAV